MKWLILVVLVACACPSKQTQGPGSGTGANPGSGGSGTAPVASTCDGLRAKLEGLYRAEAQDKEPKRVEEAVADNTTMVLNDCAKSPDKVVACVNAANSIPELESKCLRPLDDEGTEGKEIRK